MYRFPFLRAIIDLLFPPRRKPIIIAWLFRLTAILRRLDNEFGEFVDSTEYCSRWSSQTLSLETLLRDRFFNLSIFITNNSIDSQVYNYWLFEGNTQFTYWLSDAEPPQYEYWFQELIPLYSFTVHVPLALMPREQEIRAWVDKFRLAGMTFDVNYF